jgi:hypothetical protein
MYLHHRNLHGLLVSGNTNVFVRLTRSCDPVRRSCEAHEAEVFSGPSSDPGLNVSDKSEPVAVGRARRL